MKIFLTNRADVQIFCDDKRLPVRKEKGMEYVETGKANGEQVTDLTLMEDFQEVYGLCSNFAENNRSDYYISLDNIPDNPFYSSYDAQIAGGAETNVILSSLSKTYFTTMVGVFTQVAGANAGGNS